MEPARRTDVPRLAHPAVGPSRALATSATPHHPTLGVSCVTCEDGAPAAVGARQIPSWYTPQYASVTTRIVAPAAIDQNVT